MARLLTIGRVARTTGVPAKTIRYYESLGVLPRPARTAAGYRHYTEQAVQRLAFVRRARALGLPPASLKALVATLDGDQRALVRPRLTALVREQLSAVQRQITDLRHLRAELRRVLQRVLTAPREDHAHGCRCLEKT
jgi:MerR family copper efflux transcriptional regulator